MAICFTACVPSNVEKAKAKLEKADYKVVAESLDSEDKAEGLTGALVAKKGGVVPTDMIAVSWFASKKEAKTFYDKNSSDFAEMQATYKSLTGKTIELKISGKCIYVGTTDAIKDFN